jgi:hypothetical protein
VVAAGFELVGMAVGKPWDACFHVGMAVWQSSGDMGALYHNTHAASCGMGIGFGRRDRLEPSVIRT